METWYGAWRKARSEWPGCSSPAVTVLATCMGAMLSIPAVAADWIAPGAGVAVVAAARERDLAERSTLKYAPLIIHFAKDGVVFCDPDAQALADCRGGIEMTVPAHAKASSDTAAVPPESMAH